MEDLRTKESSESESNEESDLEIDRNLNFFSYVWGEIRLKAFLYSHMT